MTALLTADRLRELRANATLERTTMLEHRMREGQDPAIAVAEVPEVDELVVRELRDDLLEERGQLAEYSMARLASLGSGADAAVHGKNADRVEFALLREIALALPELTIAVWQAADRLGFELPDE